MKNKWIKRCSLLCMLSISAVISGAAGRSLAEAAPEIEAVSENISEESVLVGGMQVGIYMETDGVLVLGTQKIESENQILCEPAKDKVHSGDYILSINGQNVKDKETLIDEVSNLSSPEVTLKVRRNDATMEVKLEAVKTDTEKYKLGIWVRDNIQGLGTITFLTQNGEFGALGHGIHDVDISSLIDISGGSLYKTSIASINKGKVGMPGSMEGVIIYNSSNKVGRITHNTESGIYGILEKTDELFEEQIVAEIAEKEEIEKGPAVIRCSVGDEIKEYGVEILEIDMTPEEVNKGILLQVTDPELIEATGGIIQGMSGSPIIQDGKLVGAVTHVLVNDPTKGYGIFIENMLEH